MLAENLKTLRATQKLTQEELAIALGFTPVTVCRWETGKCEPTMRAKKVIRKFIEDNNLIIGDKDV